MKCEICNETELEGGLAVFITSTSSDTLNEEAAAISFRETTRRNYIVCDSCNKAVCHNCCSHAKNGYCDACIERYDLLNYVKEAEEDNV